MHSIRRMYVRSRGVTRICAKSQVKPPGFRYVCVCVWLKLKAWTSTFEDWSSPAGSALGLGVVIHPSPVRPHDVRQGSK